MASSFDYISCLVLINLPVLSVPHLLFYFLTLLLVLRSELQLHEIEMEGYVEPSARDKALTIR